MLVNQAWRIGLCR